MLCDKEDIFVKTCRFQVRLGGIIVIYFFNLMLNRNFGQIEVSDYQILSAIRRIQMRTILLYWFNSSTKKNAIHLDVGISLEGKSLTGTEIDKTEMVVSLKDYLAFAVWGVSSELGATNSRLDLQFRPTNKAKRLRNDINNNIRIEQFQ